MARNEGELSMAISDETLAKLLRYVETLYFERDVWRAIAMGLPNWKELYDECAADPVHRADLSEIFSDLSKRLREQNLERQKLEDILRNLDRGKIH